MTLVGLMALSVEIRMKRARQLQGQVGELGRAQAVVLNRLTRLMLHHWHMLVGAA